MVLIVVLLIEELLLPLMIVMKMLLLMMMIYLNVSLYCYENVNVIHDANVVVYAVDDYDGDVYDIYYYYL